MSRTFLSTSCSSCPNIYGTAGFLENIRCHFQHWGWRQQFQRTPSVHLQVYTVSQTTRSSTWPHTNVFRQFQIQTAVTKRTACYLEWTPYSFTGTDVSEESNDSIFGEVKYAARRKGADTRTSRLGRESLFYRFEWRVDVDFSVQTWKIRRASTRHFQINKSWEWVIDVYCPPVGTVWHKVYCHKSKAAAQLLNYYYYYYYYYYYDQTISTDQNPSWEAAESALVKKCRELYEKVHYRVHKSPPLDLSEFSALHPSHSYLLHAAQSFLRS